MSVEVVCFVCGGAEDSTLHCLAVQSFREGHSYRRADLIRVAVGDVCPICERPVKFDRNHRHGVDGLNARIFRASRPAVALRVHLDTPSGPRP